MGVLKVRGDGSLVEWKTGEGWVLVKKYPTRSIGIAQMQITRMLETAGKRRAGPTR
ncbi:MAG: hypothetical protein KAJ19_22815 [Gammaproteobacteria bacterium]|nr:hypothetical protein [Gammaproteobacteria bacterium]